MSGRASLPGGAGIAGGIAAVIVLGFMLLPSVVVVLLFVFFTVMGMIKGTDFRASTLDLPILFTGVAVLVAAPVVLICTGAGFIGRSLTPRKRPRD